MRDVTALGEGLADLLLPLANARVQGGLVALLVMATWELPPSLGRVAVILHRALDHQHPSGVVRLERHPGDGRAVELTLGMGRGGVQARVVGDAEGVADQRVHPALRVGRGRPAGGGRVGRVGVVGRGLIVLRRRTGQEGVGGVVGGVVLQQGLVKLHAGRGDPAGGVLTGGGVVIGHR